MKHLLLLLLSIALAPLLGANILNLGKMNDRVEEIHQLWTQTNDIQKLDITKLGELRIELYGNRPNVWNMYPKHLKKMRASIEPLRDVALALAQSADEHQRYHAASLLAYLEPSDVTKLALLDLARDKHSSTAVTSMDTLFGMGWDTPELRKEVVQHLENKLEGKPYRGLAFTGVGKWGVKEAVPVLIEILKKSYTDKNFKGKSSLRQFRYLGTEASEALPVLEKILAQRKRDGDADFRELESLEFAVAAVQSGGIRQLTWRDLKLKSAGAEDQREPKALADGYSGKTNFSEKDQSLERKERTPLAEKSNYLPWVVTGALLMGTLALLLRAWKGKSV
jgi:hypothetical protein